MRYFLAIFVSMLLAVAVADEPTAGERLQDLFDREWAARLDASPEFASALGNRSKAGELSSYSASSMERQHQQTERFLEELDAIPIEALSAEDLANLLTEEHPQIAAVFLAHLDRQKGGAVLKLLDDAMRADLVHRVATLDRTPADVVQRVLEVMRKKVKDLGLTTFRSEPKAWVKAAASLLNNLGGGDKSVLDEIESSDAEIAAEIREQMFTFDDLEKLDKKSMQKILAAVDSRQLAVSLKATTPVVEQQILSNLSQRASAMVVEERDNLGPTPLSEVLEAQAEILKMIRDMMDKGDIKAGGATEQMV